MRRKKNKKIDIYTALMLPLMTMFLLNIGLVATTWAWYTASISTGVNSITAGVGVSVTVKNGSGTEIESTNEKYVLLSGENTIELTGGPAATGYVVLMNIEEGDTTSTASSIIDLFFTPVYAEESIDKYYAELSDSNPIFIKITVPSKKTLSISCLWKENDEGFISDIENKGYQTFSGGTINLMSTSCTINLLNEEGTPLKQSEVMSSSTTYSQNTEEDMDAVITEEDTELKEITMPVIDGYELVSVNGEDPKETYLLVEGQDNVFNAVYKKIEVTGDTPAQEDPLIEPTEIVSDPSSEEINGGEESTTVEQEPTTPGQEQITTPDEPTPPVKEAEQFTAPSETETNLTRTNGQTVVEEENDEVGETGEEETEIEENMEVVVNAQSESGD